MRGKFGGRDCQCRENRGNPDDVTGSERGDF